MKKYSLLKKEEVHKEFEEITKATIPSTLIKFVSLDNRKRQNEKKFLTLQNNQLWFSSISQFNDPYECKSFFVEDQMLQRFGYDADTVQLYKRFIEELGDNAVIVSLSGNTINTLPMWAYYTGNYHGFCIEYEVISPDCIHPVYYTENRLDVAPVLAGFINDLYDMLSENPYDIKALHSKAALLLHQLNIKHCSWEHEQEYRVIAMVRKQGKGIRISAEEVGLKPRRIVAGINCKPEHLERLQEISDALSCGKVLQARTSKDKFTLFEEA